jgi:hypothetical protein
MDKRAMSVGTLVLLLVSTLYLPLALAEETLVGVVYRGWTEAECKSSFGNQPWITNDITNLNLGEQKYNEYKGPLLLRGQETGCYCGQEKILNQDKTTCVDCSLHDRNAVYHSNENAEPGATLLVNGKDVGCRCAKKEGNKDFAAVVNGKCTYVDRSEMNAACAARYGSEGVRTCSGQEGETSIGSAEFQGRSIDCCCEPGYQSSFNQMTQKYFCEKLAEGVTPASALCAQRGGAAGYGNNLIECPESIIKAISGIGTPTQAEKDDANARFVTSGLGSKPDGGALYCCCPGGQLFANGVCAPDLDECGQIIPNSVKEGRGDASAIRIGDAYGSKQWQKDKMEELRAKNLATACYCRDGYLPADKLENPKDETTFVLDNCYQANTCQDLVLGSVPSTDQSAKDGTKIEGGSWDATILETIKKLNIECSCPKGSVGYNSNNIGGYDVCAIKGPRCLTGSEIASFMKVTVCAAKNDDEGTAAIDFMEGGMVIIDNNEEVSITKLEEGAVGKLFNSIGYGFFRATGVRDLANIGMRIAGSCKDPSDKSLAAMSDYVTCIAPRACDQMPDFRMEFWWLRMGAGVQQALRLGTSTANLMKGQVSKIITEVGENAAKIAELADSTGLLAQSTLTELSRLDGQLSALNVQLASVQAQITGSPGLPISDAMRLRSTESRLIGQIDDVKRSADTVFTTAQSQVSAQRRALTAADGMLDAARKGGDDMVRYLDDIAVPHATGTGHSLKTGLESQFRHADDALTSSKNLLNRMDSATDWRNMANNLRSGPAPGQISTARGATTQISSAGRGAARWGDEVVDSTRITPKIAEAVSRWTRTLRDRIAPPASIRRRALTALVNNPVSRGIGRVTKTALKGLGYAAQAYFWIDFIGSTATRVLSGQVVIEPRNLEIPKTRIMQPFGMKKVNDNIYTGVGFMEFKVEGLGYGWSGAKWIAGGLFDVVGEAKLVKPPEGDSIKGNMYKCQGNCACGSDNSMGVDCLCYPIGPISIELKKKDESSGGVVTGGITV